VLKRGRRSGKKRGHGAPFHLVKGGGSKLDKQKGGSNVKGKERVEKVGVPLPKIKGGWSDEKKKKGGGRKPWTGEGALEKISLRGPLRDHFRRRNGTIRHPRKISARIKGT